MTVIARRGVVPVVVHGQLAAAAPADRQTLQESAPFADRPGAGLVGLGTDVGVDASLVGQIGVPGDVAVVVVHDQGLPFVHGQLPSPGVQPAVLVHIPLLASRAEHVGASVSGMSQDPMDLQIRRRHPFHPETPAVLIGERQPFAPIPDPGGPHRSQLGETVEHGGDRTSHRLVGVQQDLAVGLTPDKPDRQGDTQLAPGRLVANPAVQALPQHVQLSLGDRALEPQRQAVGVVGRIVDAIDIGDQRRGQRAPT